MRQCSDLLAQFGIWDYIGLDLGSLGGGFDEVENFVIRDLLQSSKMGVGISKQSDSIRSSVIKGGELISKSEVDRMSIREQEPIENPDASELASPFNEATFYQNQGVGQIKEESKGLQLPLPQPDPVEETQNLDEKIGNIRKKGEVVKEPVCTPRASEATPRKDENLKTSLMQNVFLKLGINRRKSVVSITGDDIDIKVDEKLPEEKSCLTPNPVGESSDEHKDGVDGGHLCDEVEQDSPIGRRSLMQITGEFPR